MKKTVQNARAGWQVSGFRTGHLVQIRTREEILATLDENGCIEGMPFMPEMLQYCGKVVRVSAVAHKTCETARRTWQTHRLNRMVHLEGLRCDGAFHGGCQAACNLYWNDAWLKPAGKQNDAHDAHGVEDRPLCDEARLLANTRADSKGAQGEPRYSCQATRVTAASVPIKWWQPRQYVLDVLVGNHPPGRALKVLWLASLRHLVRVTPVGYRILKWFRESMHRWLTGREVPDFEGIVPEGQATPSVRLNLMAGERVRVKPKQEIMATLDRRGQNRGLGYGEELSPYCGGTYHVENVITRIIDEETGRMLTMKEPCITLQGVVCRAEYSECRLLCPRAITPYWRELWLERVEERAPVPEAELAIADVPSR